MQVILFKSTHCWACTVMDNLLKKEWIEYITYTEQDAEVFDKMDVFWVPTIIVLDDNWKEVFRKVWAFPIEILKDFLNSNNK